MQGSRLKGVIAGIILVVLCFIIGAYAAESAVSSAAIIAAIVGVLVLILAGKRCWWLIFLLGPVVGLLPLPGPLSSIPGPMYMAFAVLAYWLLLWAMGHVKIKWRSFLLLDLLVLALAVYLVAVYIRHPVSIAFLGLDTDTMGGADYVYYACAFVYYLTLSCIPMEKEELTKVLRWSVGIVLVSCFIGLGIYLARSGMRFSDLVEERIGADRFGVYAMTALCAKYSLLRIALNPLLIGAAMMFTGCVLMCGSREALGVLFITVFSVVIIKKEILSSVIIGACALFGMYAMSAAGVIENAPYSVQRMVSVLPGIEISRAAKTDTEGTWEWRLQLWGVALDKRTGYINDYVFGDGYGQSKSATQRRAIALLRGDYVYGQDLDEFAVNGVWHNGVITIIHRLGYVGLLLVSLMLIVGSVYMFRVCFALRGSPLFFPIVFYVAGYAALIPELCLGAHGAKQFILQFSSLALIKWAYCVLREEGKLIPIWQRKRYVPQMIREHGDALGNHVS